MLRTPRDLDRYGYHEPDFAPRGGYGRGYFDRGWPPPSLREVQARWLRWLCLAAAGLAVVALVRFVVGHDDPAPGLSTPSWLMLGAAALVLVVLGVRYVAGGAWPVVRTLAEYAVVAVLAVLLALSAAGVELTRPPGQAANQQAAQQQAATTTTSTTRPPAGRAGATARAKPKATGDGCPPLRQPFAWVGCLWRQANPLPAPPSTTRGRAMAPSPTPPATRRTP